MKKVFLFFKICYYSILSYFVCAVRVNNNIYLLRVLSYITPSGTKLLEFQQQASLLYFEKVENNKKKSVGRTCNRTTENVSTMLVHAPYPYTHTHTHTWR